MSNHPWESIKNKVDKPEEKPHMVFKEDKTDITKESGELTFEEFVEKVEEWSEKKGLDTKHPHAQSLKLGEEVGEVFAGLARNDLDAIMDGLTDSIVVGIILLQQIRNILIKAGKPELAEKVTFQNGFSMVWEEIGPRTGKVVNGVFEKDEK